MIVRKAELRKADADGREWRYCSDAGGITQFGAYLETLAPGATTSEKHWHEQEDEFLHVISGEVTIIEDASEALLRAGDSACWPAGETVAHTVVNRSEHPCSYLIIGTRVTHDICHYPDSG